MARKEKNIHYIYKTTCNVTGRWYVGMHSTNNLEDGYMGSGLRLRRSLRKYGVENHVKEILEYLPTREDLVLREIDIITKELIVDDMCMNLRKGGEGGFSSEEHMVKCSKAGTEALKEKFFKDDEYREKVLVTLAKHRNITKLRRDLMKGKTHSDKTKKLMSEAKKNTGIGETNSQYGSSWMVRNGVIKKVNKNEFIYHIEEGWVKGRK